MLVLLSAYTNPSLGMQQLILCSSSVHTKIHEINLLYGEILLIIYHQCCAVNYNFTPCEDDDDANDLILFSTNATDEHFKGKIAMFQNVEQFIILNN